MVHQGARNIKTRLFLCVSGCSGRCACRGEAVRWKHTCCQCLPPRLRLSLQGIVEFGTELPVDTQPTLSPVTPSLQVIEVLQKRGEKAVTGEYPPLPLLHL